MARSNVSKKHWVGFDLGGTKMLATVYDAAFEAVGSRRRKTKEFKGPRAGVQGIIKTIDEALEIAELPRRALGGIGIGCPGVLELDRGIIQHAPNLGWRNVQLARDLQKVFACKVHLVNDVDAGTYGEYRFGAGEGARCLIGVFPGTGIGGGCVYDGKLIRGRVSSCFEFGHLHMAPKGRLCGCGRWGCLETVAGRLAISAEAASAAFRGQAPHLLEMVGTDLTAIRSRVLAEAIEAGDQAIGEIVQRAAKYLGVGVASVVNLLAPDVIVLGGGMVEAMPKPFLTEVRTAVREQAMKPFRGVRVVAAKLGDDAGVMGAAAFAADQ
ncbi:MAG TPA: ROK family protein [Myxococcales bacterium]|jgi:glucokinase